MTENDNDFLRTRMDRLILRSLQSRTSLDEEESLREWLEKSPRNAEQHAALQRLWSLTELTDPFPEAGEPPNVEKLLAPVTGEEGGVGAAAVSKRPGTPYARHLLGRVGMAGLAASLVAIGLGLGVVFGGGEVSGLFSGGTIVTGAGEMTTITLNDESNIRLGPKSSIRLLKQDGDIVADLDGRAFFGVRREESRRFIVRTEHGEAVVSGTRFEVRSEDEEFRVLVVEGSVQVSNGDSAVDLTEGEMSVSMGGADLRESRVDDVYSLLDWMGNALVFQDTPFARALREIERRYNVSTELEDPELATLTVTAAFTDQEPEDVLLVLCEIVRARCLFGGDSVRIRAPLSLPRRNAP